jgi:hypothetical protein
VAPEPPASPVSTEPKDFLERFVAKPRTITFLLLGLVAILYMAFFYPPAGLHEALRRGLGAMMFIFLVYCGIQLQDSMLVRPHPAVWCVNQYDMCLALFSWCEST